MATTAPSLLVGSSGLAISGPGLPAASSSVSLRSAHSDSCTNTPATPTTPTPSNRPRSPATNTQNPALVLSSPSSPSLLSPPSPLRNSNTKPATTPRGCDSPSSGSSAATVTTLTKPVVPPVRTGSKTGGLADLIQRPPFDFAINLVIRPQGNDATTSSSSPHELCSSPIFAASRSPSDASTCTTASSATSGSAVSGATPASLPHSLHRRPTEPIPEEGGEETESDSPNEPLTPISGRQSRDFQHFETPENNYHRDSLATTHLTVAAGIPEEQYPEDVPLSRGDYPKAPVHLGVPDARPLTSHGTPAPSRPSTRDSQRHLPPLLTKPLTNRSNSHDNFRSQSLATPADENSASLERSKSRNYSSSSLKRAMGLFRRSSHAPANGTETPSTAAPTVAATPTSPMQINTAFREPNYSENGSAKPTAIPNGGRPSKSREGSDIAKSPSSAKHSRRFSLHRSMISTRSNTPPDSDSSADAIAATKAANRVSMPPPSVGFSLSQGAPPIPGQKKARANTGLSLRGRMANFAHNHGPSKNSARRTRSVERIKPANPGNQRVDITRSPWAMPPDAGTGMKARRLSLSLPDDFTVDVAELMSEFEYQHKLLGRHGKHLGKGATSKVTLMTRKGTPSEMYAVKEFRGKGSSETTSDYENKIKSEYSIAKSLHHPNIVETIRLCTNHGRWNHVMEYCSEGDLFNLVSKKYLKEEDRERDRLCLFKQVCQGINYLHNNGIAHRDIKLENLLVTKDSKIKITDFGVSEVFSGIHPGLREAGGQCGQGMDGGVRLCKPGICGSMPYIAPEVLSKQSDYDPRALDVWSAAIVMVHLVFNAGIWEKADKSCATQGSPYYELANGWEKLNAKKETNPDLKDAYPKVRAFEYCVNPAPLRRILLNMLNPDPSKRWTMSDVINHRWMKNVECCQLETYDDPVKFLDVSKKNCMRPKPGQKIFCHNHLPLMASGSGLPPMPGKAGY